MIGQDQFVAKLGMDTRRYDSALKRSERSAKRFKDNLGKIGAVIGTAFLGKLVKDMAALGDKLGTLAVQTDLSVEEIQKLQFAAEKMGSSSEAMSSGLEAFAKRLGQARNGTGELLSILNRYGVSLRKQNGEQKSVREVLADVTDLLENSSDAAEEAAIASAAFSRANQDLSVVLRGGNEELEKFGDEAERIGAVLDQEAIDNLDALDKSLKKLKASFVGLAGGLISKIVQGWSMLFNFMRLFVDESDKLLRGDFGAAYNNAMNKMIELENDRLRINKDTAREMERQGTAMSKLIAAHEALREADRSINGFTRRELLEADTSRDPRLHRAQRVLRFTEALRERAMNQTRLGFRRDNQRGISNEERARRELALARRLERMHLQGILRDADIEGLPQLQQAQAAAASVLNSLGLERPGIQGPNGTIGGTNAALETANGHLNSISTRVERMETAIQRLNE